LGSSRQIGVDEIDRTHLAEGEGGNEAVEGKVSQGHKY